MAEQVIYLHTAGALPGIPGESHAPGAYLVDYEARTIRPLPVNEASPIEVHVAVIDVQPAPGSAPDNVASPAHAGG